MLLKKLKFVQVNHGARENLGNSLEELQKITAVDIKSKFTLREFEKAIRPLRDGKKESIIFNTIHERKDGSLYNVEDHLQLMHHEIPPVFVSIIQDITERIQAEAQLIQAGKMATLGEMATGMAHELNQPLNIIHMVAESMQEMAKDDDLPAEVLEGKLGRILSQTDRASAIINHMRMFGRRDSGEMEVVDLKEAVQGAVGLVKEQLRLNEIELSVNLPETCRKVMGQQLQLEQVVLNLITNARDAIEAYTADDNKLRQITISITDDPKSEEVRLTVKDTGGGVPDAVLERIFEPFFTTKEVGQGTGLGLSISYGIITEMGGRIEVENTNSGAKFTIIMPTAI